MVVMGDNSFELLRRRIQGAEKVLEDESISPEEVLKDKKAEMEEKVALSRYRRGMIKRSLRRLRQCKSASDVFSDFAKDAAKASVMEMFLASGSADRQRAAEGVLNRALGKPVDRVMSVGVQVSSMTDQELDYGIEQLLEEIGFKGGQGKTRTIPVIAEGEPRFNETSEICSESRVEWRTGVPRKIYKIDSES